MHLLLIFFRSAFTRNKLDKARESRKSRPLSAKCAIKWKIVESRDSQFYCTCSSSRTLPKSIPTLTSASGSASQIAGGILKLVKIRLSWKCEDPGGFNLRGQWILIPRSIALCFYAVYMFTCYLLLPFSGRSEKKAFKEFISILLSWL